MKITAAVLHEKQTPMRIEELELIEPNENEVKVKVIATGICHADESFASMYPLPAVFGHEGAGIVVEAGKNVHGIKPGDHVVMTYGHCACCDPCKSGKQYACRNFAGFNGPRIVRDQRPRLTKSGMPIMDFFGQSSFATYVIADQQSVIPVEKDVDLKILGPLGCGIQTGAGTVLVHMNAQPDTTLVVMGCGAVGFAGIMAGKVAGCKNIIAVGGTEDKLNLALELGATHIINRRKTESISKSIKDIIPSGADYVLDTTGNKNMVTEGIKSLAVMGHLSVVAGGYDLEYPMNEILDKNITISGILEGGVNPHEFIPQMVQYVKDGSFQLDKIEKFYSLNNINKALKDHAEGKVIKPIIVMPD